MMNTLVLLLIVQYMAVLFEMTIYLINWQWYVLLHATRYSKVKFLFH